MNVSKSVPAEGPDAEISALRLEIDYCHDLLKFISHEIKNTVASIHGYNRMSSKYLEEKNVKGLTKSIDHIERLSTNLYGLCESLHQLNYLDQDQEVKSDMPLDLVNNAIMPVLQEMRLELENKKVKINIDSLSDGVVF